MVFTVDGVIGIKINGFGNASKLKAPFTNRVYHFFYVHKLHSTRKTLGAVYPAICPCQFRWVVLKAPKYHWG